MAVITDIKKLMTLVPGEESKKYIASLFDEGSETLKRIYSYEPGTFKRFDVCSQVFAMEQAFDTKERAECFFESHRKYVDVQIVLKGEERIDICNISALTVDKDYEPEKDLITYMPAETAHRLSMRAGDAAVFYPDDAHMCVCRLNGVSRVYKTVLKIPVELF